MLSNKFPTPCCTWGFGVLRRLWGDVNALSAGSSLHRAAMPTAKREQNGLDNNELWRRVGRRWACVVCYEWWCWCGAWAARPQVVVPSVIVATVTDLAAPIGTRMETLG